MLAAWHASLEVGQPIANRDFLVGAFPALGDEPARGAEDRRRASAARRRSTPASPRSRRSRPCCRGCRAERCEELAAECLELYLLGPARLGQLTRAPVPLRRAAQARRSGPTPSRPSICQRRNAQSSRSAAEVERRAADDLAGRAAGVPSPSSSTARGRAALAAVAVVGRRQARVVDARTGSPRSSSSGRPQRAPSAWRRRPGRPHAATARRRGRRRATPPTVRAARCASSRARPSECPRWPRPSTSRARRPRARCRARGTAARSRPSRRPGDGLGGVELGRRASASKLEVEARPLAGERDRQRAQRLDRPSCAARASSIASQSALAGTAHAAARDRADRLAAARTGRRARCRRAAPSRRGRAARGRRARRRGSPNANVTASAKPRPSAPALAGRVDHAGGRSRAVDRPAVRSTSTAVPSTS